MTYFRFKTIDPRYLMGLNAPTKEIAWQQLCMIGNRKLIEKYRITAVPTIVIADKKLSVNIQEEEIIDAILYAFISSVKI